MRGARLSQFAVRRWIGYLFRSLSRNYLVECLCKASVAIKTAKGELRNRKGELELTARRRTYMVRIIYETMNRIVKPRFLMWRGKEERRLVRAIADRRDE